ncbi:MAG: DUF3841 domain-containing protein [bacterium]|nr:DUF3841 domain-containing protein [bacterium]
MPQIKVWTRQHKSVLDKVMNDGRYIAKRDYIYMDLQEHANLVLEVYDWLVKNGPDAVNKPADVTYPVWVSFDEDATMLSGDNGVVFELTIAQEMITPINIAKWGAILNYSYIPINEADKERHRELLEAYGIDDVKAFMTQFYPAIKKEIISSWDRLFDENVKLGNDLKYGTIWEIRKEWVTKVIQ